MINVNTNSNIINKEEMFQNLLDDVLRRRMQPEDQYEIAALLESFGWNDLRVSETFGAEDVFSLASSMWEVIQSDVLFTPFTPPIKQNIFTLSFELLRNFIRGAIFALPMAISVFSMLTLRFSLWSYENLTLELATSIAIGTILSFMVVGGFTQAIARRGFFYIAQNYYNMGRRITFYFIKLGYVVCFVISILFLIVNSFLEAFPFRMSSMVILYFFFLSTIWLSVTVMYILRKEIVFTGLLIIGIIIVYILFKIFNLDIIFSQIISLIVVSFLGAVLVFYFFKSAEMRMEKGIQPDLPRMSITVYSVMPYFIYGFLYFTFIYADRGIAWSTNNVDYMPYLIWFRGPYELGLDLGLLMLTIPMGFNEVVVTRLMQELEISEKNFQGSDTQKLNSMFLADYFKRLAMAFVISILTAVAMYFIIVYVDRNFSAYIRTGLLSDKITHFVFICSLFSYAILAVALMNAVILFSISQPEMATKALIPAFLLNILIGFLLSRWIEYHYAVLGLLAGSILFVVLSTLQVVKVLKDLDYYIYASS